MPTPPPMHHSRLRHAWRLWLPLIAGLSLQASAQTAVPVSPASAAAPGLTRTTQDVRFVVFHTPGPAWQADRSVFEQPGIRAHIAHYRQWLEAGKLQLGGPHLDARGGGMMIPAAGIPEDEIRRFAEADPAVQSGLLRVVVRPWLIGMGS
ncbi:YciI family protein [Roseateles sp. DB2]|uniref:YciI family protein n=1 Tax=Roseateles sp. DB2 TaxID=3453717 RepID=UPI003EF04E21